MANKNKVLRSFNLEGAHICVDIFCRPDGSFGFEEYRRDPEDPRGWFRLGDHGHLRFDSVDAALRAARVTVSWLNDVYAP